jgi:hypothetical protein
VAPVLGRLLAAPRLKRLRHNRHRYWTLLFAGLRPGVTIEQHVRPAPDGLLRRWRPRHSAPRASEIRPDRQLTLGIVEPSNSPPFDPSGNDQASARTAPSDGSAGATDGHNGLLGLMSKVSSPPMTYTLPVMTKGMVQECHH